MAPRRNTPKDNLTTRHPTGIAGSITAAALVVLGAAGVEISPELSAAIVGLVVAVASALSPRYA